MGSARHAGAGLDSGVEAQRVHIDNPYADEKALLLSILAEVNGARSVWSPHAGSATVMGYPVDLRLTDLLFTSLLVQATHASAEATSANRRLRTPSFRRAFLIAYSERIGERLEAAKQHVAAAAEEQYGSQLLPILASREAAIAQSFTKTFPDVVMGPMRRVNAYGYQAGRAAAERANIGAGKPIGPI